MRSLLLPILASLFTTSAMALEPASGTLGETRGPVTVPLAPVLDPAYRERLQRGGTVETVVVPGAQRPGWLLAEVLRDRPRAESFRAAVERVGLNERLDPEKGFTAFVPVVTGRNSSDPVVAEQLDDATRETLSQYIVRERVNLDLIATTGAKYKALDGSTIKIHKMGGSVNVNGVRLIDSEKTPQGFIYYIRGTFPSAH